MRSSQPYARWTRAWHFAAVLVVVALLPCFAVGSRLAEAVGKPTATATTTTSTTTTTAARVSTPARVNTTAGPNAAEKVVFREDFNGTRLDSRKWNPSWFGQGSSPSHPVNGKENDCYDPRQAIVHKGYLILAARTHNCLGHTYASGLVNTNGHFSFTTGTLKARVWLPPGNAPTVDWPAVWTNGQHWPNDGEIDVVEGLGGHDCWHVHTVRPTVGACASIKGGWHIVEMIRTKTTLTFFYDNKKVGTASTAAFANSPHYIVINLAVSKTYSPPEKPAFMLVDWVQVTR